MNGINTLGRPKPQTCDNVIINDAIPNRRRSSYDSKAHGSYEAFEDQDHRRMSTLRLSFQDLSDFGGSEFRLNHYNDSLSMENTENQLPFSFPDRTLNSSKFMCVDMSDISMEQKMVTGMDISEAGADSASHVYSPPGFRYPTTLPSTGPHWPPLQYNFSDQVVVRMHDPGRGCGPIHWNSPDMTETFPDMRLPGHMQLTPLGLLRPAFTVPNSNPVGLLPGGGLPDTQLLPKCPSSPDPDFNGDAKSTPLQGQHNDGRRFEWQHHNGYLTTGLDVLGVLMRIATRPNPQIKIGTVDMSCAFVVCDAQQHALPIVYCSDVFEQLTCYTKHETVGRNCRFLQAPDGNVKSGIKRKYVDDRSVLHIKNTITSRQETQCSLINYRKGGHPFLNLLTVIPITWNTQNIKYYVGFQVDLVEQPNSVSRKNPNGTCTVDYRRSVLPQSIISESDDEPNSGLGKTFRRDDLHTADTMNGNGASEVSKRIRDRILLESADDVIHALSPQGLFLYLSSSSRKVLEYDPAELIGTTLSSICHPSDVVPVMRELTDATSGAAINITFRVRRKYSGYLWFESHGSFHSEQDSGLKFIIMAGRERPVYALARNDIISVGGIGESELWTKMSTSGMFLYVSSNVRKLLGRERKDLVGTSAHLLMTIDSNVKFGRNLELVRGGLKVTFNHDVLDKRDQALQAQTTLYPGDASKGQRPSFLVAQTRLLKVSPKLNCRRTKLSPKTDYQNTSPASSKSARPSNPAPSSASGNINPVVGWSTQVGGKGPVIGNQHETLTLEENLFDELKTTRSTNWQFEIEQMKEHNQLLTEELQSRLLSKRKRKRRAVVDKMQRDCADCYTRVTPEWRRGPSGDRDLCNSCGLRWAKENGGVTPKTLSLHSEESLLL